MQLTIWLYNLGIGGPDSHKEERYVECRASAWYDTFDSENHKLHVDNVTLQIARGPYGYANLEGTPDEMEKVVEMLQDAIKRNRSGKIE